MIHIRHCYCSTLIIIELTEKPRKSSGLLHTSKPHFTMMALATSLHVSHMLSLRSRC